MRALLSRLDTTSGDGRVVVVGQLVHRRLELPDTVVSALLADPSEPVRHRMAISVHLTPSQIDRAIATGDGTVLVGLITRHLRLRPLPGDALARVLGAGHPHTDRIAAYTASLPLSPAQVEAMRQRGDPLTLLLLAVHRGVGSREAAWARILESPDPALWAATLGSPVGALPEGAQDRFVRQGGPAVQEALAFHLHQLRPDAQQVRAILASGDIHRIQDLLLTWSELLTEEQAVQGALTGHERHVFDFSRAPAFRPSAAVIEQGLNSDRPEVRRTFVAHRVPLTAEQLRRALQDPDDGVRRDALRRADVRFDAGLVAACLADPDYRIRSVCVANPSFPRTAESFEAALADRNPNLLNDWFAAAPVDASRLSGFVDSVLRSGRPEARLALARQQTLALSAAQLQVGSQDADRRVAEAFQFRREMVSQGRMR